MLSRIEMRMTGALLLLMSLLIILSWTGLMISFDYPDILRKPVEVILQKIQDGGTPIRLYWVGMIVSSLLILPIVMLFYRITNHANRSLSLVSVSVGLFSAICHILGFSRWVFTVDYLASQYSSTSISTGQKEAIEIMFNAIHMYLGVTVGETLGFFTMGVWAILISIALYQAKVIKKWLVILSIASGLGIVTGVLEWIGWSTSVEINAYAYQLWILIIAYLGVSFIIRKN